METPNQALSDAARAMGRVRSRRKTEAARANGKLGGRPRNKPAPALEPEQAQPKPIHERAELYNPPPRVHVPRLLFAAKEGAE